jgi:hypothetical protein
VQNPSRLVVFLAPVLALATLSGCQACVVDSSQPEDPQASRPAPGGSGVRIHPRLMSPVRQLVLADAGAGDE